jgi:hypothetical protein
VGLFFAGRSLFLQHALGLFKIPPRHDPKPFGTFSIQSEICLEQANLCKLHIFLRCRTLVHFFLDALILFADVPPAVEDVGKPKPPPVDEALLQRKLADIRQIVRNLTVMGMRPDLSADKRELIRNAERSARAEAKLRIKAFQYCREQQRGSCR